MCDSLNKFWKWQGWNIIHFICVISIIFGLALALFDFKLIYVGSKHYIPVDVIFSFIASIGIVLGLIISFSRKRWPDSGVILIILSVGIIIWAGLYPPRLGLFENKSIRNYRQGKQLLTEGYDKIKINIDDPEGLKSLNDGLSKFQDISSYQIGLQFLNDGLSKIQDPSQKIRDEGKKLIYDGLEKIKGLNLPQYYEDYIGKYSIFNSTDEIRKIINNAKYDRIVIDWPRMLVYLSVAFLIGILGWLLLCTRNYSSEDDRYKKDAANIVFNDLKPAVESIDKLIKAGNQQIADLDEIRVYIINSMTILGAKKIKVQVNKPFNGLFHEVETSNDNQSRQDVRITKVIKDGYTMNGVVVLRAKVEVNAS